jgi:glycosyltransferase involved in cell wall biosynthesis
VTEPGPRVAFGLPAFNRAQYLEEALESLLSQSYREFVLVVVDDGSTDATPEIVARYVALDARVHYQRNSERVGMVENWRQAFYAAAERAPGLEYFAFASDHDVWHPLWLESMVRELDADPDVVVAFPLWVPIAEDGTRIHNQPRQRWDTAELTDPRHRLDRVAPGGRTPNVVYGLFRACALERCDVYSFVLAPDRLLMTQLAVLGTFKQVESELWKRRLWRDQWHRPHQRTRLFTGRAPFHTYLPTGLVHGAMLFRWLVLRGRGRPEVDRTKGLRLVGLYMRRAAVYPTLRRNSQVRRWAHRRRKSIKRHSEPLRRARKWARAQRKSLRRRRRHGLAAGKSAARFIAAAVVRVPGRRTSARDR